MGRQALQHVRIADMQLPHLGSRFSRYPDVRYIYLHQLWMQVHVGRLTMRYRGGLCGEEESYQSAEFLLFFLIVVIKCPETIQVS